MQQCGTLHYFCKDRLGHQVPRGVGKLQCWARVNLHHHVIYGTMTTLRLVGSMILCRNTQHKDNSYFSFLCSGFLESPLRFDESAVLAAGFDAAALTACLTRPGMGTLVTACAR